MEGEEKKGNKNNDFIMYQIYIYIYIVYCIEYHLLYKFYNRVKLTYCKKNNAYI